MKWSSPCYHDCVFWATWEGFPPHINDICITVILTLFRKRIEFESQNAFYNQCVRLYRNLAATSIKRSPCIKKSLCFAFCEGDCIYQVLWTGQRYHKEVTGNSQLKGQRGEGEGVSKGWHLIHLINLSAIVRLLLKRKLNNHKGKASNVLEQRWDLRN